jgi:transketolase
MRPHFSPAAAGGSAAVSPATPAKPADAALTASLDSAAHAKAIELASAVLETCASAGVGNPTVAIGAAHVVSTLLYQSMRWDPAAPREPNADRLILSDAAHAPLLYAAYADLGVPAFIDGAWRPLATADLARLGRSDGPLPLSPLPGLLAPVNAVAGAAGSGLSLALGAALAARLAGDERRHFVLIGDGELREGVLFEALAHLAEERLAGVTPVFLLSPFASGDRAAAVDGAEALARRLAALGFHTVEIDGHAPARIRDAVDEAARRAGASQPTAILARIVKGWGARSLQGGAWTGRIPTGDKLRIALEELRASRVGLTRSYGVAPSRPTPRAAGARQTSVARSSPESLAALPDFTRAMREADMTALHQTGRLAPRRAHALALRVLGRAMPELSLLESEARRTLAGEFFMADRALAARAHEFRGAEQHMVLAARGLAAAGRAPFVAACARNYLRTHEELLAAAQEGAALRLVATDAGLSAVASGPASTALSDLASLRPLTAMRDASGTPALHLLQPSDAYSAYALTLAAARHEGLSFLRVPAGDHEYLYTPETEFRLGRFEVLVEGRDLLIVTAGAMVHEVNRALDGLDDAGIDATIVDLYSIPFDEAALLDLAKRNGGRILVVEDNQGAPIAGAVSEACTASGNGFTLESMCVRAPTVVARTFAEALVEARLSAADIVARASRMVGIGA